MVMNKMPAMGKEFCIFVLFCFLFYVPPCSTKGIERVNRITSPQKAKINMRVEHELNKLQKALSCAYFIVHTRTGSRLQIWLSWVLTGMETCSSFHKITVSLHTQERDNSSSMETREASPEHLQWDLCECWGPGCAAAAPGPFGMSLCLNTEVPWGQNSAVQFYISGTLDQFKSRS